MRIVKRRNQSVWLWRFLLPFHLLTISAAVFIPLALPSSVSKLNLTKINLKKDLKTGQLGMSSLDAVLFEAGLCQVWQFKTTDVEKVSPDAFDSSWWPLCVWIIITAPGATVSGHSHGNNGFKIKLCCRSINTASYELAHRKASYQKSKDETNKLFILMSQIWWRWGFVLFILGSCGAASHN